MKLLDLLNVIEDDTPIWIYIDHPFPCKTEKTPPEKRVNSPGV